MASKQEKIKAWLIEQGYDWQEHSIVFLFDSWSQPQVRAIQPSDQIDREVNILGIFKGTEYIKLPDFQDDQPQPKDKALQEYIEFMHESGFGRKEIDANIETNNRIKDLEAAVARLEAANEKA